MIDRLAHFRHFMQHKIGNGTFGRRHVGREMGSVHVCLPQLAVFPILEKDEETGILVVLMQVILQTALLGARDVDELQAALLERGLPCREPP